MKLVTTEAEEKAELIIAVEMRQYLEYEIERLLMAEIISPTPEEIQDFVDYKIKRNTRIHNGLFQIWNGSMWDTPYIQPKNY